jgi:hypothetical protein
LKQNLYAVIKREGNKIMTYEEYLENKKKVRAELAQKFDHIKYDEKGYTDLEGIESYIKRDYPLPKIDRIQSSIVDDVKIITEFEQYLETIGTDILAPNGHTAYELDSFRDIEKTTSILLEKISKTKKVKITPYEAARLYYPKMVEMLLTLDPDELRERLLKNLIVFQEESVYLFAISDINADYIEKKYPDFATEIEKYVRADDHSGLRDRLWTDTDLDDPGVQNDIIFKEEYNFAL